MKPTQPELDRATWADADRAWRELEAGNRRWVAGELQNVGFAPPSAAEDDQAPFAAILSCSDSRTPVELIFDRGIGDIFTVRVAGNAAHTSGVGSLEYGVAHLGIPLVVVLGHTGCGAVAAAVDQTPVDGAIARIVAPIAAAAEHAREHHDGDADALLDFAIEANVFQAMADLIRRSAIIRDRLYDRRIKLVGAVYDLHTGWVRLLGAHPQQDTLLTHQAAD